MAFTHRGPEVRGLALRPGAGLEAGGLVPQGRPTPGRDRCGFDQERATGRLCGS